MTVFPKYLFLTELTTHQLRTDDPQDGMDVVIPPIENHIATLSDNPPGVYLKTDEDYGNEGHMAYYTLIGGDYCTYFTKRQLQQLVDLNVIGKIPWIFIKIFDFLDMIAKDREKSIKNQFIA